MSSTPPRRPPGKGGLELLIRKRGADGEDGFEIKVVRADRAFLRMRPQRRPEVPCEINRIEEADGPVWMLHLPDRGRHLRLTAAEWDVFQRMDGRNSIQDLATALVIEHGRFDFDLIRRTLGKLRAAGLVEERRPGQLRTRILPGGERVVHLAQAIANFDHRWEDVDPMFGRLHRVLGAFFTRPALALALLLGLAGLVLYLGQRASGGLSASYLPAWSQVLLFLALLPPMMAVHELAHGLCVKVFGRRVQAVGITLLDYVLPSVYVDVTDMYMSTRTGRVMVALAGPLASLVLLAVSVLLALSLEAADARALQVIVADVNFAIFLYTAWPFSGLQEDGYDALSELLAVPTLRRRALDWARARLRRSTPPAPIPTGAALLYLGGLVATWTGVAAAFAWQLLRA